MVGADRIDLLNLIAEGHRLVRDEFDEVMRCALACKQFELAINGIAPCTNDASGDLNFVNARKRRAGDFSSSFLGTGIGIYTDNDSSHRVQP